MAKLTVLYGHPTDPGAFDTYFAEKHIPLVCKMPNVTRFEAGKVVTDPRGGELPYYFIAELWFEDLENLRASMESQESQAADDDVSNFATGGATLFVSGTSMSGKERNRDTYCRAARGLGTPPRRRLTDMDKVMSRTTSGIRLS